jgi:hypothetical protein
MTCLSSTGCTAVTEPAGPVPRALVGTWEGEPFRYTPRGMTTFSLAIEPSGRFTWTVRTTGLYEGQAPNALTSTSREVGQLTTANTRAFFQSDSVYILNVPDQIETARRVEPTVGGFGNTTLFDEAEFDVRGNRLVLRYLSYPADAPVPTLRQFTRVK